MANGSPQRYIALGITSKGTSILKLAAMRLKMYPKRLPVSFFFSFS